MTYTSLIGDLQAYLERGQTTDPAVYNQLPKLIENAQRRIARSIKILGFQQAVTSTFVPGTAVLPKPDRWRETISFNFGNYNPISLQYTVRTLIVPRSYEFIRSFWPDDTATGQPQYFADYNYNNWIFAPTPDQAYPFEVLYWELPALLDAVNQQNWLTQYAPEVLLYSSLLECTPFLKDDGRIPTWEGLYQQGMQALSNEDIQDLVSRATQTRQTVGSQ